MTPFRRSAAKSSKTPTKSACTTIPRSPPLRRSRNAGWQVKVTLAGAVRATFRDAAGEPLAGLAVSGVFAAPADMSRDRRFAMRETEPGVYVGATPPSGVWDLTLEARRSGQTLFRSNNRIKVR